LDFARATHIPGLALALFALASHALAGSTLRKAESESVGESPALTFARGLLTLDIEERLRWEVRDNNRDFNRSVNGPRDDGWLLSRFRLGLAIRPSSWLKIYAQMQDTREWFSTRGNVPGINGGEGGDYLDLRLAYFELGDPRRFPLSITLGRQSLTYGDSRLVASSRWGNFGRTFDGVKLRLQTDKSWVDAFAVRPVQVRKYEVNDSDSADTFLGIYGGTDAFAFQTTELYFLWRDKVDAQPDLSPANTTNPSGTFSGPAQRIATVGTRWKSKPGALRGFDYSAEVAYQFGDLWTGSKTTPRLSHRAFATAITGGYTWMKAAWKPRIGLEYDYASGDRNPNDGGNQGFISLYSSNHASYGFMDLFVWRNLHDARLSLSAKPRKNVDITLDYHAFWLAETSDYWYTSNANGVLRTTIPAKAGEDVRTIAAGNFAGHEVDFTVNWKVNSHLSVLIGCSHFFAGDYLRDTGAHSDANFGYAQATLSF
jgi:hypothetical protein